MSNAKAKQKNRVDEDSSSDEDDITDVDFDDNDDDSDIDDDELKDDDDDNSNSNYSGENNDDNDDDDDDDSSNNNDSNASDDDRKVSSKLHTSTGVDELDKAKAVTTQLRFWEHLLKMRVNLQKALVIINQLPQCERLHELMSDAGAPCQQAVANGRVGLKRLLDELFEIESLLLSSNMETKSLFSDDSKLNNVKHKPEASVDDDDEEITSESEAGSDDEKSDAESEENTRHKRKLKFSEYTDSIAKRHKTFEKYRNSTIQKWADKTQSLSKFAAFDQSVAKQIQQTVADKSRLVARTRVNRLGHCILGSEDTSTASDKEIFDDNDFYHHILREFIQYKNSYDPIVLTKQWLEIQQYRKKAKKNVDRKASKGRKTRYSVHKPLINFMAPTSSPDVWDNDQRDDLFKNLFGKAHFS